jgi:hypothetical protein
MFNRRNAIAADTFRPKAFSSSLLRLVMVNTVPFVAGILLARSAYHYFITIPPGDAGFRGFVTGLCIVLALALGAIVVFMFNQYSGATIQVEAGRLVIKDSSAMVSSDWSDVSMGEARRSLGIRHITINVAGRQRIVDEFFYPNFDEICDSIKERVKAFDKAVRRSMVVNDWIKAG